jgi:hypothetical protein
LKWRVVLLVAGCAGLWPLVTLAYLGFANATATADKPAPSPEQIQLTWLHGGVATLLCALPSAVTLLWCDLVLGGSPEQQLAAVFGGTGLRMAFVVAVGMVLYLNVDSFHDNGFWLWVIVFYLTTLTLEMVLVVRRQAALDKKRGEAA